MPDFENIQNGRTNEKITIEDGIFVAVEGIDGTGKTTLVNNLEKRLSKKFYVKATKEPSDSEYGRKLRNSFEKGRLSSGEELQLFVRDRKVHLENVIRPYLNKGYIVITDRYYFSNIAYQGAYGENIDKIKKENMDFPYPDMVLYIYLDIDTALTRIAKSRGKVNKIETRDNINKVKEIYEMLEEEYSAIFCRINGNKNIEELEKEAINKILKLINSKTGEKYFVH